MLLKDIQTVFQSSPIPSLILNPDNPVYTVVYANPAFIKMLNQNNLSVTGKSIFSIIQPGLENSDQAILPPEQIYPINNDKGDILYLVYTPNSFTHFLQEPIENTELANAKEQYQNLFNSTPVPCWVFDTETLCFLDVNTAAIANYGYTREEFLSMTIKEIRPREDLPLLQDILQHKIVTGLFDRSWVRHTKKSGEIISVVTEGNSLIFKGKQARIVISVDITNKLQAERILSGSEQRFKSLVQEGSDLIAILTPEGKYLYVSPTSEKVLSIKPEFFIDKNAFDFMHPDDLTRITGEFSLLAAEGRIRISPYRFKVRDEYRWIETIITDMTADPAVAGIVANSRDVTQEIERELKMKESIERFDMVSRATSDTIYDYNMLTAQVKWNKGISGIFGYKKNYDTSFDWWSDKVHPDDIERIDNGLNLNIRNKSSRLKSEYRFKCANGSYKYVLDRSFIIYDDQSVPVRMIGAMEDITEKISYIMDIETQNARLREISWMQSHTVRAPLARLMGLAKLISDEKGIDKELLTHFSESAAELDKVIRSIINKTEHLSDRP